MANQKELKEFFKHIVSDNLLHQKWLRTLSYLEYSGVRKIFKFSRTQIDWEYLVHGEEEAKHARLLFEMAKDMGSTCNLEPSQILGGITSKNYLSQIELFICKNLLNKPISEAKREECYVLTTVAIELRAMIIYPIYEQVLRECDSPISVAPIIEDEKGHLDNLRNRCDPVKIEKLVNFEHLLFKKWFEKLTKEIGQERFLPLR